MRPEYACVLWTVVQTAASVAAFAWAMRKSNRVFFSVFAADAFVKLASIGTVWITLGAEGPASTAPLVWMSVSYVILSLAQIPFLNRFSYELR